MKTIVSVVIPTYNRDRYVAGAIRSAQNQTYKNIEIIVVDDGSTDDTSIIVKSLQQKDSRIKYLKVKHSGLPALARNAGLRIAKGDWIALLDSDDLWMPGKLNNQLELARKYELDFVSSNAIVSKNGKCYFQDKDSQYLQLEKLLKENIVLTSSVLVKSKIIKELGGFCEDQHIRALEDYELWLEIAAIYRCYFTNDTLLIYTTTSQDSIRNESLDHDIQKKTVFKSFIKNTEIKKINVSKTIISTLKKFTSNPLISVIMPTYNTKLRYLTEAVSSILGQSFSDFELIIVDDNSDVTITPKLLKTQDNRIKIIRNNKNSGIAKSLNIGIKKAKGKYIARMDSDDISLDNRLIVQKHYLDNHPEINIVGSWIKVFGSHNYVRKTTTAPADIALETIYRCPVAHPSIMFRTSFVRQKSLVYISEYDGAEDYELWSSLIYTKTMANISEVLLHYRTHDAQVGQQLRNIQDTISDKIRGNLLNSLIKNITKEEKEMHNKIAKYQINSDDNPIDIASCVLKVVSGASKRLHISKMRSIKRVLLESYSIVPRLNYPNKLKYLAVMFSNLFINGL